MDFSFDEDSEKSKSFAINKFCILAFYFILIKTCSRKKNSINMRFGVVFKEPCYVIDNSKKDHRKNRDSWLCKGGNSALKNRDISLNSKKSYQINTGCPCNLLNWP